MAVCIPYRHLVFVLLAGVLGMTHGVRAAPPVEITRGVAHPVDAGDHGRFHTTREAAALALPTEADAFTFAIFGDRTSGTPSGLPILEQAVRDVNLFEPDFLMTVGDLIQGYNQTPRWLDEMREFKGIMGDLLCPWFPVAGNHDVYWRGPGRPDGEHEANYEMHFGPLWYAFEHKDSWFIVLYSDEGNPETGEKAFGKPASQKMSAEQFVWLDGILKQASDAQHVFVFLHHPRWRGGGYGDDWDRCHQRLARAGNVRAVFAGHIHRLTYDGPRDGIEYVSLATTGGSQSHLVPEAGYLDHYMLVTVRDTQIALATVPVGEAIDVRQLGDDVTSDTAALARMRPSITGNLLVDRDGHVDDAITVRIWNPTRRPIRLTTFADSADSRWSFTPDHTHLTLQPAETSTITIQAHRPVGEGIDPGFRTAQLVQQIEYLTDTTRYTIPESRVAIPLIADLRPANPSAANHALHVDGRGAHARIPSEILDDPDGPLTVECWFNARVFRDRTGLITKTETSDYGIFVSNGIPSFYIFLGDRYVELEAPEPLLHIETWHHIAGVYDGERSMLFVDGQPVATNVRSGVRRTNDLPFIIGGDVDGRGRCVSPFDGLIDDVRISSVARYDAPFTPQRAFARDDATVLLIDFNERRGPWVLDGSANGSHPMLSENATLFPIDD